MFSLLIDKYHLRIFSAHNTLTAQKWQTCLWGKEGDNWLVWSGYGFILLNWREPSFIRHSVIWTLIYPWIYKLQHISYYYLCPWIEYVRRTWTLNLHVEPSALSNHMRSFGIFPLMFEFDTYITIKFSMMSLLTS